MPRKRTQLPVVISRWFEDGHCYARSSNVDPDLLVAVANLLNEETKGGADCKEGTQRKIQGLVDQGRVIGIQEEDTDPLDPKARDRPAHIIRTAVCPKFATLDDEADILRQLKKLRLPDNPGDVSDLQVYLYYPPEVPLVPVRGLGVAALARWFLTEYGLWLLVAFTGVVDIGLLASGLQSGYLGLSSRMTSLFALVVAVSFIRKPWPKQSDLGNLEWQWYARAIPNRDMVGHVAKGARIVKPDGANCEVFTSTPIQEMGVFRDPDVSVMYDACVHVCPGLLVLSGAERVIANGASLPVAFSRIYVWRRGPWLIRGRWQLDYAQWTPLGPGAAASVGDDGIK